MMRPRAGTAATLASMILMAAATPAGSALPPHDPLRPPAQNGGEDTRRPIVCLIDSAFGMDEKTPRVCFSVMSDAEYRARKDAGKGYIGLGFARVVTPPTSLGEIHKVYDIRDTTLSEYAQWAFRVCWARIDQLRSQGKNVPAPPCFD